MGANKNHLADHLDASTSADQADYPSSAEPLVVRKSDVVERTHTSAEIGGQPLDTTPEHEYRPANEAIENHCHEFNNLLLGAIGTLELLTHMPQTSDPVIKSYIDRLKTITQRMAAMIVDLRSLGKSIPPSAANIPEKEPVIVRFNLSEFLGAEMMHWQSTYPNIHFYMDIPADIHVLADRADIERALLNVFINARESMNEQKKRKPANQKECRITIYNDDKFAYILFQDSGTGIEQSDKTNIQKRGITSKEEEDGHGLGLPILIKRMNKIKGNFYLENNCDLPISEEIPPTLREMVANDESSILNPYLSGATAVIQVPLAK